MNKMCFLIYTFLAIVSPPFFYNFLFYTHIYDVNFLYAIFSSLSYLLTFVKFNTYISLLGDSILSAKQWMLALEGKVFITPTNLQMDFTSALAVLFGSHYAFNIEYQPEAASTLDFIQR